MAGYRYDDNFVSDPRFAKHDQPRRHEARTFIDLVKSNNRWHLSAYTVKKHDTIWDIAREFNTDYKLIINCNTITEPGKITEGTELKIPNTNGIYYTVKKGDTLLALSKRYGIPLKRIKSHNSINDVIKVGCRIFIPDAVDSSRPKSLSSRALIGIPPKKISTSTFFTWPASGRISSSFGNRIDPFSKTRKFHCGIDISLEPGTSVRAARAGKVIYSGWKEGYGNIVVLRHKNGYITVYAHNKKNLVSVNDDIRGKQIIALSGMTGAVTGAHLHFEVRKYLTPLNPIKILR